MSQEQRHILLWSYREGVSMETGNLNEDVISPAEFEEKLLKRAFSVRLRTLRESAEETQAQVATALGFRSESVYQSWEKETGNWPGAVNLSRLAAYFNVSVDYLLGRQPLKAEEQEAKHEIFQLALKGEGWESPKVSSQLNSLKI